MLTSLDNLSAIALFLTAAILLVAVFFHFLPELTRHDIFFAVTVDPRRRNTAEAKAILRRFRIAVWIHTLIGLAISFSALATQHVLLPLVGILWQTIGSNAAFFLARKRIMPYAVMPSFHRKAALFHPRPGIFHWVFQLGPFAILAAFAVYLHANWQNIPQRFPVHWGLNGEPNGWSTRSLTGVYTPLFIGFAVCMFVAVFSYGVIHWTRHVRSTGPDAAFEARFRRIQLGLLLAVQYFLALVFGSVPLMALRSRPENAPSIAPFLLGTFAFVAILYAILIHSGQGGANLANAGVDSDILSTQSPIGDRTSDDCWKAGMFYVNPGDPALLVEKRFGIGYTLNFGRPAAWFLAAAMLAIVIVPLVWL